MARRILLTRHARIQQKERRIPFRQIQRTLETPDQGYPDPRQPDRTRAERTLQSGNLLRVIYSVNETDDYVVITVIRIQQP